MFKKLSLIAILAILPICAQSQEKVSESEPSKFGFTAGFINSELDKTYLKTDYTNQPWDLMPYGGSGLFLGFTFDTEFSDNLGLSSELLWAFTKNSGDHFRLNALFKYRLFNSKFHLLAGPEVKMLNSTQEFNGDKYGNSFGFNLTGGLEYDISNRYSVYAKYSKELTNRYSGSILEDEYEGSYSGFRIGLKFRF